ncbi:MAG TPA: hypothetical protein VF897_22260 [Roseiflexaceae bacterium]
METNYTQLIAPGLLDSQLKLHLLLLFCRHPRLTATAAALSERLRESPWAIEDALEGLASAGTLARVTDHGRIAYRLAPNDERRSLLECLAADYDDPLRRDRIYDLVRVADQERRFRAWVAAEERTAAEPGAPGAGRAHPAGYPG